MLKLTHFRISNFKPTKIGTNITLELLTEDLPRETRDELEQLWKDSTSCAGIIQDVETEQVVESKPQLVGKLHFLMQRYCEKEGINFEKYNEAFKAKYDIVHKNELSEQQLIREIESHQA